MISNLRIAILTSDGRSISTKWGTKSPSIATAPSALLSGFTDLDDIEVHVVYCLREPMDNPMDFIPGIHFHQVVVPKWGWMSSLYLGCIGAVRKCLAEIQPDIVHGQGTERDCAMEAVHSGFSNVLTIHGNMTQIQRLGFHGNRLFGALASLLERHALARTNGVFCNSMHTQKIVEASARKTWLVPNAIRKEFFQPSTGPHETKIPVLLNVGMVYPLKRQLEVLKSLRLLKRSGHDFKIIFAGGLSETSDYGRRFIKELKAAEKEGIAEYVGFLDIDGLIQLMDRCSGFIHFPAEEAFGLVVAEAMARGLKVFGANLGGIVDIAEGIDGAELFDQLDDMQSSIARWLDAGAHRCPEAAAEIAKRYHPKIIAKRHVEIYQEILVK